MKTWTSVPVPTVPLEPRGGPLTVHDTSTGARVRTRPQAGTARLYVCGITPYDATHMGHAATYVTFDLLQRVWRDAGLAVRYVQNVTDVDEPLLERAARDGVDWQELAADQIALFHTDMESLRVLAPDHYVGAIEGIPDDVEAVESLIGQGTAYPVPVPEDESTVEGAARVDHYLDLATQPTFGAVSGWSRAQMMDVFAERGGDPERVGKRDPLDPLLWRAGREGEPHWPGGSLGRGRPGWHIECSTIAAHYLGPDFDVQGGGTDLIFPHHEMSAVEGAALHGGARFAQAYVHQAMVGFEGEKMSKSRGNLVVVSRLREAGVDPMAVRLALLAQHYRTEWEWTGELLVRAEERLRVWRAAAGAVASRAGADVPSEDEVGTVTRVRKHLAGDLDAPRAMADVDVWAAAVLGGGPAPAPV
ncbi:cysteine--1-D-myo-inosityl 2-amino-2-deoxy-alpha-D-glucopyranoside ligase, partial [Ornithinimicrobium sp. LYQ121]|uniref:cysteine--1-D-myo-inosityl 2-amino-2-deoxy-alpha-D-glucopyranoside ligase n=1 Tax=Ornithinimicrobium sp. LYQ121 TaxID=3378801 RepID=UPI00385209C7